MEDDRRDDDRHHERQQNNGLNMFPHCPIISDTTIPTSNDTQPRLSESSVVVDGSILHAHELTGKRKSPGVGSRAWMTFRNGGTISPLREPTWRPTNP